MKAYKVMEMLPTVAVGVNKLQAY